ncbi:hypothetical protein AOL_s00140g86 [Orbilia oligospora ATCC 24927]|uniref:UBC core domain-containing protein n=2 Tax=Orbilia oligospora TaxID=2813651 RepID=G1XMB7_ARTOA|nr:hypothetical protein AOL_s00140g86 [Orbilia oligospora ATCC 24927]EGX45770.1 hypothetical protein AOL_s00140g86 [Orbilia oligospora ATCC 24927]KAF3173243.1 hypothetical protein TWF751_005421 [Orbilia oligospora]TGJ63949.1 hypothetical protein EYR41_010032 [Orbilia oligospora]
MLTSQSFRERQLLTEFATLRTAPIPGVYLTPHPTTPTTWYGVIFLHSSKNLYSNLPIRFTITFPTKYPEVPPFVVLHATSSGSDDLDRNWNGNGGVVIHPLVSRGGIINNRGFGGVGGYAAAHTGAVNLRDCFGGWFEPRGTVTVSGKKGFGSIGRKGGVKLVSTVVTSPISPNFSFGGGSGSGGGGSGSAGNGEKERRSVYFPKGTSPIEVIFWVRSIFTDKYLEGLERRFEEEKKGVPNTPISPEVRTPVGSGSGSGLGNEAAVIVDDEAWNLWKNDREELRRRVDEVRRTGLEEGGVYQEWEGSVGAGGDVPIRFLDLERAALDTIKENLGRRFEGVEG